MPKEEKKKPQKSMAEQMGELKGEITVYKDSLDRVEKEKSKIQDDAMKMAASYKGRIGELTYKKGVAIAEVSDVKNQLAEALRSANKASLVHKECVKKLHEDHGVLIKQLRDEYERACGLVAQMHEAAVGAVEGPRRGVVEDVADLKSNYDRLKEHAEQLEAHNKEMEDVLLKIEEKEQMEQMKEPIVVPGATPKESLDFKDNTGARIRRRVEDEEAGEATS